MEETCPLCGSRLGVATRKRVQCRNCRFTFKLREIDPERLSSLVKTGNELFHQGRYYHAFLTYLQGFEESCWEIKEENRKYCFGTAYNMAVACSSLAKKFIEDSNPSTNGADIWIFRGKELLRWLRRKGDEGEDIPKLEKELKELESVDGEKQVDHDSNSGNSEVSETSSESKDESEDAESNFQRPQVAKRITPLITYTNEGVISEIYPGKSVIDFSSIAGYSSVKEQLFEFVVLRHRKPEIMERYGLDSVANVLLYGPPGNGKTLMIEALAGEMGIPYLIITPSTVLNMYTGTSERNLATIFNFAKSNSPLLLGIDELDGIGYDRNLRVGDSTITVISQLLFEIGELRSSAESVFVVGTSNSPWLIDPALLRTGRFDKWIFVPHPCKEERKSIFEYYLKKHGNFDLEKFAKMTEWASASEIRSIVTDALMKKARDAYLSGDFPPLTEEDLEQAIKVRGNLGVVTKRWYVEAYHALSWNSLGVEGPVLDFIAKAVKSMENDGGNAFFKEVALPGSHVLSHSSVLGLH
ncbi:hypothetical protein HS7_14160 [Sulfolobales archaeon HS-7]|nr:hypothetical protein HS7_14160 [Sulfolobales archaeon HS-7]